MLHCFIKELRSMNSEKDTKPCEQRKSSTEIAQAAQRPQFLVTFSHVATQTKEKGVELGALCTSNRKLHGGLKSSQKTARKPQ